MRELRRKGSPVSFNAWLITVISKVLTHHPEAAAYLNRKRSLLLFKELRISMMVEKMIDGQRVPLPLVIENAAARSNRPER